MRWIDIFKFGLRRLIGVGNQTNFLRVAIARTATVRLATDADQIGAGSRLDDYCELSSAGGGRIVIGERCEIGRGVMILSYGGNIKIGNDCSFNPYCMVYGHGGLTIGDNVRIATHTVIIPANHKFDRFDLPIREQGLSRRGVIIEDDVWVGAQVVITDGVRVGQGAVVGAGAVVTADVPPYTVCAGVPARTIGHRRRDHARDDATFETTSDD